MIPQLAELLTRYGPVGYIWFDTPGYLDADAAQAILRAVRERQVDCMASSRLGHQLGDFESLPDQMVPQEIHGHRCETAMTHNDSWAYSRFDTNWKTPGALIRQLVQTVSCGANYLLNVGPRADGTIPAESVTALRRIGAWLKVNGESIYGCWPNPLGAALPWGVATAQPGRIYLHVFDRPRDGMLLVPHSGAIERATLLATDTVLDCRRAGDWLTIALPDTLPDADCTVIRLTMACAARHHRLIMPNQINTLGVHEAQPGEGATCERVSWMHETFGNWHHRDVLRLDGPGCRASFEVEATGDGAYTLVAEYANEPEVTGGERHTLNGRDSLKPRSTDAADAVLRVAGHEVALQMPYVTPGYFELKQVVQERIVIPTGRHRIEIVARSACFPELVALRLVP